jgi:hypothetical protein
MMDKLCIMEQEFTRYDSINSQKDITDCTLLKDKACCGIYWFETDKCIISLSISKILNTEDGIKFKYCIQEEGDNYHDVCHVKTHITQDRQVKHTARDKYGDGYEPDWSSFVDFFKYITGWDLPTDTDK